MLHDYLQGYCTAVAWATGGAVVFGLLKARQRASLHRPNLYHHDDSDPVTPKEDGCIFAAVIIAFTAIVLIAAAVLS